MATGLQAAVVPVAIIGAGRSGLISAGPIRRLRPRGAELADGRVVKADAVICCTGFPPARATAAGIVAACRPGADSCRIS